MSATQTATATNVLPFARPMSDQATRARERVMSRLADGRWHTAKDIIGATGVSDRIIREVAERSDGEIIPGQKGYRLTRFATATEARRAESWLQSQGRKMIARAIEIRNARARCRPR